MIRERSWPRGRGRGRDAALLAVKHTHSPARLLDSQEDLGGDQPLGMLSGGMGGAAPFIQTSEASALSQGAVQITKDRQTDTPSHTQTHTQKGRWAFWKGKEQLPAQQ